MKTVFRYLNPNAARTRFLKTEELDRKDRGFSLIETMAAMAIIAILALAIVPQFGKYMERAAVQNVIADISSAQLLVDSDYSLTGNSKYSQAGVTASILATKHNPETTLAGTVNVATNSYVINGTSTAVSNYTMSYDSAASVLSVKRVS